MWCDDHLTRSRSATIRTRLQERAKRILLIALATSVGLTPQHLVKVAAMLAVKATTRSASAAEVLVLRSSAAHVSQKVRYHSKE